MNDKQMKTALVTGGNRGIGFAICQGLIDAGFEVIIGSRSLEKGEQAAKKFNSDRVSAVAIDIADDGRSWLGKYGYGGSFCTAIARTGSGYGDLVGNAS